MTIKKLDELIPKAKEGKIKRLVAAAANDNHTIEAVNNAVKIGIVKATLTGDENLIKKVCQEEGIDINNFEIIHEPDENKAALLACKFINDGKADFIMKGLLSTDKYMRALLNKEQGLVPPKGILSHITVMDCEGYDKLLICSDVAIIPLPDLTQKIAIANYIAQTGVALGFKKVKIAAITATEQVLPKLPSCVDAAILSKMSQRGQIKNAIIEGPISLDLAIDKEAAQIKKFDSPVAGDADGLLFPNIEAGNIFYKSNTKLSHSKVGAIVVGAKVPAVLSSRGDSVETKLFSIALAAVMAK